MVKHLIQRLKWRCLPWWVAVVMIVTLLPSCMKKTHFSDLENREGIMVKKGEGLFTGKAWSSDDRSVYVECEKGRPVTLCVFYDNGRVALRVFFKAMKVMDIFEKNTECSYYDIQGNPISEDEFLDSEEGKEVFQNALIYLVEVNGNYNKN